MKLELGKSRKGRPIIWSLFLYLSVVLHDTPSLVLFIDACQRLNREIFVSQVGFGDLSTSKFYLVYWAIYQKISLVGAFSPQNLVLHFEICESSESEYAINKDHSSNATAATNYTFFGQISGTKQSRTTFLNH